MNAGPQNFDRLRRMLALKRHEQPPPGYFHGFSAEVISRIKAGERGEPDSIFGRLFGESSWLQRLRDVLEAKPAYAGAFGAAVCALLISGIVYSENGVPATITPVMASETSSLFDSPASLAMNGPVDRVSSVSSTNPVASSASSLFDQFELKVQPVNLVLPAGN